MVTTMRKAGTDLIGDAPWGTHFCLLYQTKEDLLDILVPYFKAGLENNEFCMWITSEPLGTDEALAAMERAMPNIHRYLESGQLEIMPHTEWYLKDGCFDAERVLDGWVAKHDQALAAGYDGLRLTGNTFWLEKEDWRDFTRYEETIDSVIGNYRMIAFCTYSLDRCGASEVVDVVKNHQFALVKRDGKWELIESAERRRTKEALRESEARYQFLFENMLNGFAYHEVVVDESGRPVDYVFLEVNDAFEKLTGLRREDIVGKRVTEAIPGIEKSGFDWIGTYGKVALTGEEIAFEQYAAPLHRWYAVSAYSPKRGYFVALFFDITKRKRAEEEVNRLNEHLQRRATDLAAINKELETFSYSVSHDLRAPLRSIDGFSQALLEDYADNLDGQGQEYLQRVRAASQRMGQLIDDLLTLSRVTRSEMRREPVDLTALARGIAEELRRTQPERQVDFAIAPGLVVSGDARLLRIMLENLLGNAWKFTGQHAHARIELRATQHEGEPAYCVRDDGAGFDMAYVGKLFGAFQRLHSPAEFPGSGIGLATVQRVVHRHGGRVWAEGAVEQGATFYFTLPSG